MTSTPWAPTTSRADTRLIVLIASAVAIGFSLLLAGQTLLSMMDHGHSWWRIFGWHLGSWAFWVPFAPWIVGLGSAVRWGDAGFGVRMARLWIVAAVLAAAQLATSGAVATLLQPYRPVSTTRFLRFLENEFLPWVAVDLMVFWCLVAVGSAVAANQRSRAHELRETRLETELARAQLDALRLEIQPHFLFNTLNSVAALIRRQQNPRALEVVLGLSELLRSTLDRSERHLVPLEEEIDFVERYVKLQQTRFGDRLAVSFDIDDAVAARPVPWLVLQPLVENAIRHGVSPRVGGGRIEIRACRVEGGLRLEVVDDGPGPESDAAVGNGIGLQNVRSRLHQLYEGEASVQLVRTGGMTVATVFLPDAQPVEPPAARDARLADTG